MSKRDAIEALQTLGLGSYEARVFVTLQQLGGGTAQAVSKHSEVPRSQVYGAADDLADRGLVEVVETSPKEYRPVGTDVARAILDDRLRRERDRAFENLEAIRSERESAGDGSVSTLRGRAPIDERLAETTTAADAEIVLVVPGDDDIPETLSDALLERAEAGVAITVVIQQQGSGLAFADHPNVTVTVDRGGTEGYTGRILLVDGHTILLSVLTDDGAEPTDEMALWTAESKIAGILAQFVHAGIQRVLEDRRE